MQRFYISIYNILYYFTLTKRYLDIELKQNLRSNIENALPNKIRFITIA